MLAAAGGHAAPTLYVLLANDAAAGLGARAGTVLKGQIDPATGTVPSGSWAAASGTAPDELGRAHNLIADPYQPGVLYATDLGAGAIKSTRDGGQSWHEEPELTRLATRDGEFRFDCGDQANGSGGAVFDQTCSLAHVAFVRGNSQIRVAVLFPGGVAFSRDAGRHWIPLVDATTELDRPQSAFYDPTPNPQTGAPSLYVALRGRGLIRVDAPFATLQANTYEARGLPAGRTVIAVNDTTRARTTLHEGADGSYRGVELYDSALVSSFRYRYVIDGRALVTSVAHTVSPGERGAGVVALTDFLAPHSGSLGNGAVIAVDQPQSWSAHYVDDLGGSAVRSPSLGFVDPASGNLQASLSYDLAANIVCLSHRSPLADTSCTGVRPGARLANRFLSVDVGAIQRSVTAAELVVTWAFTVTDSASRFYTVTSRAVDGGAHLPWQEASVTLGVTHPPQVGTLTPNTGSAPVGVPVTFTATFSDPDGVADLDLVRLTFETVGVSYDPQAQRMFIDTVGTRPECTPGSGTATPRLTAGGLSLDCTRSGVTVNGSTLTVSWVVAFQQPLAHRTLAQLLSAEDLRRARTGFVRAGSFTVR
jgi:hypothetical protein